jgi:hypothetical protein
MTSIFPERDAGCGIQIADQPFSVESTCSTPLGYVSGRALFGLVSLKEFLDDGGSEVSNAKILVYVKTIGKISSCTSTSES